MLEKPSINLAKHGSILTLGAFNQHNHCISARTTRFILFIIIENSALTRPQEVFIRKMAAFTCS
jgi:hypothetical protein